MVLGEKQIEKKLIFSGRMINLRKDTVMLPNGKETTREVIEHPGAVAIVAVNGDNQLILVRQYRYPIDRVTLEIPAGKLDPGESKEDCVRRELKEETGYETGDLMHLCSFYTTPGFTDEIIHLFFTRVRGCAEQDTDEDEFIEIEHLTPDVVMKMIKQGEIMDSKTILGVLYAKEMGLLS